MVTECNHYPYNVTPSSENRNVQPVNSGLAFEFNCHYHDYHTQQFLHICVIDNIED